MKEDLIETTKEQVVRFGTAIRGNGFKHMIGMSQAECFWRPRLEDKLFELAPMACFFADGTDEVLNGWRVIEDIPDLLKAKTLAFETTICEALCAAIEKLQKEKG